MPILKNNPCFSKYGHFWFTGRKQPNQSVKGAESCFSGTFYSNQGTMSPPIFIKMLNISNVTKKILLHNLTP